jgi:uncharacterized membrane protein YdjX (TVP38/TMEM64 family)
MSHAHEHEHEHGAVAPGRGRSSAQPIGERTDVTVRVRFVVLVVMVVTLGVFALVAHTDHWLTVEGLQAMIGRYGILSPLVYVVVATLLVVAWAPRSLLSMVAGALFGIGLGSALALLMGVLSAMGGYAMGAALGQAYVDRRVTGRSRQIVEFIRRRGFLAVLIGRIFPLFPTELVSVASGTTGIRLGPYALASTLGIAPGAFLCTAFGASLLDHDSHWISWATAAAFLLMTVVTSIYMKKLWQEDQAAQGVEGR